MVPLNHKILGIRHNNINKKKWFNSLWTLYEKSIKFMIELLKVTLNTSTCHFHASTLKNLLFTYNSRLLGFRKSTTLHKFTSISVIFMYLNFNILIVFFFMYTNSSWKVWILIHNIICCYCDSMFTSSWQIICTRKVNPSLK